MAAWPGERGLSLVRDKSHHLMNFGGEALRHNKTHGTAASASIEHAHRGIFLDFKGAVPAVAEDLSDLLGCSSVPVQLLRRRASQQ